MSARSDRHPAAAALTLLATMVLLVDIFAPVAEAVSPPSRVLVTDFSAASATRAASTVAAASVTHSASIGDEPPGSAAGTFQLPLPPPADVLTPFRPPADPYGTGHRGVDLSAPAGSVVRAAGAGTVVFAGPLAGRGVVSVQHPNGIRTTYEPVTATVAAGQSVHAGDAIGTLEAGHAPCAPADCLHWGARLDDGTYLDPMSLVRPWRVRLKPWDSR